MLELVVKIYDNKNTRDLYDLFCLWDDVESSKITYDIFLNSLNCVLKDNNSKIITAYKGNEIVGYAQIFKVFSLGFGNYYEIDQILVMEDERKNGVGKKIIRMIEDIAKKENIFDVRLNSQIYRTKAHIFYENIGYEYYKVSKFYKKIFDS